jgi:acyl dehydratase
MIPVPGSALPTRTLRVDADHIRLMALILRDPNPIHYDPGAPAAAGLGDREVNQGGTTMAYLLTLLGDWAGSRAAVVRFRCRFRANVFAGDVVTAGGTVTAVRAIGTGNEADCEVWVDRADGSRAVSGTATVVLPCQEHR